jgi:LysM repeat protein
MKWRFASILFLFFYALPLYSQSGDKEAYIERYKDIAIREMKRAGVPASIKLAQGILESNAGKSELARQANNHFGIKCGNAWTGPVFHKEDDDYDDQGTLIKSCFRKYKNPEASFIAHSEFLRDPAKVTRYGFLFRLNPQDYKSWANGLRAAGYATNPNYPALLINLIEDYQLNQYDQMGMEDTNLKKNRKGYSLVNDVRVTFAKEGITPRDIASQFEIPLTNLYKWNERLSNPANPLPDETPVFLQRKRISYRGKLKYHYVKENENMYAISQQYGIRLVSLYKKNNMPLNTQPAVGEKLQLKGCFPSRTTPDLRGASPVDTLQGGTLQPYPPANTNTTPKPPASGNPDEIFLDIEIIPGGVTNPSNPTIPTSGSSTNSNPNTGNTTTGGSTGNNNTPTGAVFHEVVKGDTLFNISKRYGTTVIALKELNGLTSDTIKLGQRLKIK